MALHPRHCSPSAIDLHYRPELGSAASHGCDPALLEREVRQQAACHQPLLAAALRALPQGCSIHMLGDSVMLQQFLSAMVMLSAAWPRLNMHCPDSSDAYAVRSANGSGWIDHERRRPMCARSRNWRRGVRGVRLCYSKAGSSNPLTPNASARLRRMRHELGRDDLVVANFGLHELVEGGMLARLRELISLLEIEQPGARGGAARLRGSGARLLWRETTPQHHASFSPFGEAAGRSWASQWRRFVANEGNTLGEGPCAPLVDRASGRLRPHANKYNEAAEPLLRAARVPIVRVWNRTRDDWTHHLGFTRNRAGTPIADCTHYCLPSPTPNLWTLELFAMLTGRRPRCMPA